MVDQSVNNPSVESGVEPGVDTGLTPGTMPWWRWAYRLLRVAVMLILVYWLSRSGDAFFYQGF